MVSDGWEGLHVGFSGSWGLGAQGSRVVLGSGIIE